jgi:hypothetical protein
MKLQGLVPNSYIHVSGRSYLESLFSCIVGENSRLNRRSREKGRELPPSRGWRQFPALPPLMRVEPRVHINDQHPSFQFGKLRIIKWKPLILVVNLLFGLSVNEIPNKTFILDSHEPFICSVHYGPLGVLGKLCCKVTESLREPSLIGNGVE